MYFKESALFALVVSLSACATTGGNSFNSFKTDGCSSFPNGTGKQQELWLSCCISHDEAYWVGGSYQERVNADKDLKDCVAEVGEPEIAQLMLAGVRVGGTPFLPTTFRWGYGWQYPRLYRELTEQEKEIVEQKKINNP